MEGEEREMSRDGMEVATGRGGDGDGDDPR